MLQPRPRSVAGHRSGRARSAHPARARGDGRGACLSDACSRGELERVLRRRVSSFRVEPLEHGPPAATAGLWRVQADGERLVLKLLRLTASDASNWPAEPEPGDAFYWRREADAYASGLLDRPAHGLRAARLTACVERSDGSVALWVEDVRLPPATAWPPEAYALAARRLGRAQGEPADELPQEPWLSRRWLRAYVERRRAPVEEHGRGPTRDVWESREDVLRRIEAGPQTLCHLDLHPKNVFGDARETVLVDWAYCGIAAVGEDATTLVLDALFDGFAPAAEALAFEHALWRAYTDGLRDVGWGGDAEAVCYAHVAGAAVKYAWIPAAVAARRGPYERWARVVPLLDVLAEEASRLASAA